jgi:SAM-dependent methyltransferase
VTVPITSVVVERTNAALITRHVRPLWLREDDLVLDVTYGDGRWWDLWRPPRLIGADLYKDTGDLVADFRELPFRNRSVDVVAYDPPYIPQGGRETSTLPEFMDRYGLETVPVNHTKLFTLFAEGMAEVARVLKRGGRALVKCMDFVEWREYHSGFVAMVNSASYHGLWLEDVFIHVTTNGAQPKAHPDGTPRQQWHSWRTHSYLLVFLKERKGWSGPERVRPLTHAQGSLWAPSS